MQSLLSAIAGEIIDAAHFSASYDYINAAANYRVFYAAGVINAVRTAVANELGRRGMDPSKAESLVYIDEGKRIRLVLLLPGTNCHASVPSQLRAPATLGSSDGTERVQVAEVGDQAERQDAGGAQGEQPVL